MSHFSVIVITDDEPTEDVLSETLMPWHEYECTGYEEYLQEVDVTDTVAEYFNKEQAVVVLSDGSVFSRWNDRFYTQGTSFLSPREFNLPVGAVEKKLSAQEARKFGIGPKTMQRAAIEYYGSKLTERDGRFYRLTNPNAKWDWWSVGGRYMGRLMLRPGSHGIEGRPGAFDNKPLNPGGVDSCQVHDLDLDAMREQAERRAAKDYDKVANVIRGRSFLSWDEVRAKHAPNGAVEGAGDLWEAARAEYAAQPVIRDIQASHKTLGYVGSPEEFRVSREEYLAQARLRALSSYAVVKDGKWYERGEMGWWGVAHNEKDQDAWDREFAALLDGLQPEQWVTIVDCHT